MRPGRRTRDGSPKVFVGFFETARHAARRYHLTWRVLAASARSDHPFFAKARRVTLLPVGLAGLAPADDLGLRPQETIMLAPFLMACDEVAINDDLYPVALSGPPHGGLRRRGWPCGCARRSCSSRGC